MPLPRPAARLLCAVMGAGRDGPPEPEPVSLMDCIDPPSDFPVPPHFGCSPSPVGVRAELSPRLRAEKEARLLLWAADARRVFPSTFGGLMPKPPPGESKSKSLFSTLTSRAMSRFVRRQTTKSRKQKRSAPRMANMMPMGASPPPPASC